MRRPYRINGKMVNGLVENHACGYKLKRQSQDAPNGDVVMPGRRQKDRLAKRGGKTTPPWTRRRQKSNSMIRGQVEAEKGGYG